MVRDLAMHLYVCILYLYNIYPSQSIIDTLIDCTIDKMVPGFLLAAKTGVDCKLAVL